MIRLRSGAVEKGMDSAVLAALEVTQKELSVVEWLNMVAEPHSHRVERVRHSNIKCFDCQLQEMSHS